jgi:hypothetical protein
MHNNSTADTQGCPQISSCYLTRPIWSTVIRGNWNKQFTSKLPRIEMKIKAHRSKNEQLKHDKKTPAFYSQTSMQQDTLHTWHPKCGIRCKQSGQLQTVKNDYQRTQEVLLPTKLTKLLITTKKTNKRIRKNSFILKIIQVIMVTDKSTRKMDRHMK